MGFDERAATWDASERRRALADAVASAIKKSCPLSAQSHLLDFGAGTGLLSRRLLPSVAKITAVDTSSGMLERLLEATDGKRKIRTRHEDILGHECPACYDGIVSSMTMHHVADTEALLRRLYALLKPGGFLAVADLMPEDGTFHDRGNDGVHHFGFDEASLTGITRAAGFEEVRYRPVFTVVKEGGREYDVFLLTARKPARR